MPKRRLLVPAVLFSSVLVLTACSGTSAEAPTSAASTSSAESSSSSPSSAASTETSRTTAAAPVIPAPDDRAESTCVPGITLIEQNQGPYYTLGAPERADINGAYALTTVIPGQYPGRTEHVHVKVTAPGGPTYTTQLYFSESTANGGDRC